MKAIKWNPPENRPPYVTTRMYGAGVMDGRTHHWESEACFAPWSRATYDEIHYKPRYNSLEYAARGQPIIRYAINQVVRKIFPIIPTYSKLCARDITLKFNTDEWSYKELNLMLRIIRSMHEQPSVLTSCYHIHQQYPTLEAPWILGLASMGTWDSAGILNAHTTYCHRTFDSTGSGGFSLARVLDHCMNHQGKLFVGQFNGADNRHHSYHGVSHLTESSMCPVKMPDTLKKAMCMVVNYAYTYNGEMAVAIMKKVRLKHRKNAYSPITLRPQDFKKFIPQANEDASKKRIW